MDPRTARGFLNNNPGNMDRSADTWQGEIKDAADPRLTEFQRKELTTGRFCVFVSPQLGIRAMAKNLFAYRDRLGLQSIKDLIFKWAPPVENNSSAYAASVANRLGVSWDAPVNVRDYKTLYALVDAIIRVECGGMPYTGTEIEDGLVLAGVVKPVGVTTSKTATGLTIASGATIGGAGIAVVQETVKPDVPTKSVAAIQEAVKTAPDPAQAIEAIKEPLRQTAESLGPLAGTSRTIDTILLCAKIGLALLVLVGIGLAVRERMKRQERDRQLGLAAQENGQ